MTTPNTPNVDKLNNDLLSLEKNTSALKKKVDDFDTDVEKVDSDLEIPEQVASKLKTLDSVLSTAHELLEVAAIIPEIDVEASELDKAIRAIKSPVHKAATVSEDMANRIKPVRKALAKLDVKLKALSRELKAALSKEQQIDTKLEQTKTCVLSIPADQPKDELVAAMEKAAAGVDPAVEEANKTLVLLLDGINKAQAEIKKLEQDIKGVLDVEGPIDQILKDLNPILGPLKAVVNGLSHVIRVPYGFKPTGCKTCTHIFGKKICIPYPCGIKTVYFSFSVKEILDGVSGVLKPVEDLLEKAMNAFLSPLLKALHLNITLPSIPGIDGLAAKLQDLLGPFAIIPKEIQSIMDEAEKLEQYIDTIEADIQAWQNMLAQCEKVVKS